LQLPFIKSIYLESCSWFTFLIQVIVLFKQKIHGLPKNLSDIIQAIVKVEFAQES